VFLPNAISPFLFLLILQPRFIRRRRDRFFADAKQRCWLSATVTGVGEAFSTTENIDPGSRHCLHARAKKATVARLNRISRK